VYDIDRFIIHKAKIVSMHLKGYQTAGIVMATEIHASSSVDRYLADFDRFKMLFKRDMEASEKRTLPHCPRTLLVLSKNNYLIAIRLTVGLIKT
jgi:hypothetical protein